MKKIPCLFERDFSSQPPILLNRVTPGCEWVLRGEGVATVKFDGSACMIRNGQLFRRYDARRRSVLPVGFEPCQEPDLVTGHYPGWVPVGDEPDSKYHLEAFGSRLYIPDGTYELIGWSVNGNPYGYERGDKHVLVNHGIPLSFADGIPYHRISFWSLGAFLETYQHEGIVWHHPDGRMVKLRRRDFGFLWPIREVKL